MGEYGPGLTSGQTFMLDKERIKRALMGELVCGENDNGFEYAPAPQEECRKFILQAYDNAVYQCIQAHSSGRAMERLIRKETKLSDVEILQKFVPLMQEETLKYNDYEYETEIIDD